jgi:uncharacterized membrane protein (DUF2068 family)
VFALIHKNLNDIAERLTETLRVNPEGKLSCLFLNLANRATDKTLWVLAIGALVDATVRSIEAFGLWRGREWAQWFALLSGALYLPGELYSLVRQPSCLKWGVLVANAVIFLFYADSACRVAPSRRVAQIRAREPLGHSCQASGMGPRNFPRHPW